MAIAKINNINFNQIDSYTKLLLHFDGADGAKTYTAETGQTVTFVGTAQLDTAQYKFGTSSLLLDGNSDCVTLPDSDDWHFGTGDFTIDCWIYPLVMPTSDAWPTNWSSHMVLTEIGTSNSAYGCGFLLGQTKLILHSNDTQIINATHGISINNWYHLAVTRSGNDFRLFVNGIQIGSTTTSTATMGTGNYLYIGCETNEGAFFNGYIDELRISKGIARWTTNFTPPTRSYSNDVAKINNISI